MPTNPKAAKDDKGNPVPAIDVSEFWDIDAHRREGGKTPWSFFAYPRTLADEQRLPRDEESRRYLVAIHRAGVRVGIEESRHAPEDFYFACPFEEFLLLNAAIKELERQGTFPNNFAQDRCEYLYSLVSKSPSETPQQPPNEVNEQQPPNTNATSP